MLKIVELVAELKKMQTLYDEVYPLIEGLPFVGNHSDDESPLHYFAQAANLCNLAESFISALIEHVRERNQVFTALLAKINRWENRVEAPTPEEMELFERIAKRLERRGSAGKQVKTKILKKVK